VNFAKAVEESIALWTQVCIYDIGSNCQAESIY